MIQIVYHWFWIYLPLFKSKPYITSKCYFRLCCMSSFSCRWKITSHFAVVNVLIFTNLDYYFWLDDWKCTEKSMKRWCSPGNLFFKWKRSHSCIGWTEGGKVYLRLRRDSTFWNPSLKTRSNLHARPICIKVLNMYKSTPV